MNIGFTGTRKGMTSIQKELLEVVLALLNSRKVVEFHHGACVGSDAQAHEIALRAGSIAAVHPPINKTHLAPESMDRAERVLPAKEYLERDRDIVNETQLLIATPGGYAEEERSGTWYTVRYAKTKKKLFLVIWPDGKVSYNQWYIRNVLPIDSLETFLNGVRDSVR